MNGRTHEKRTAEAEVEANVIAMMAVVMAVGKGPIR